ncbi:MAG TPA: GNAT family N-acetyltransferase [Nocardioidaceae bacterium]|nr:GNAT family N-acetyltransferase [Nocardioidaceae bacterium]
MHLPTLSTERLVIRTFELDDLDACQAVLGDVGDPVSVDERRNWLRWTVDGYGQLESLHQPPYGDRAIVRRSDGRLIGACGLVPYLAPFDQLDPGHRPTRWTPEVGLYYELGSDHRGRGYATEAVRELIRWAGEELRLDRIVATTTYDNAGSIAMMERLGMTIRRNPLDDPPWFQVVGTHEF